jgi:hypothetical protein
MRVVAVEAAGEEDVVQMQTSSRTYFAEGFLSHNCRLDAWLQQWVLPCVPGPGFTPDPAVPPERMCVHSHPGVRHLRADKGPIYPSHGCGPKGVLVITGPPVTVDMRLLGTLMGMRQPPGGIMQAICVDPERGGAAVAATIRAFLSKGSWRRLVLWHTSVLPGPIDFLLRHLAHTAPLVVSVDNQDPPHAELGLYSVAREVLEAWPSAGLPAFGEDFGRPTGHLLVQAQLLGVPAARDTDIITERLDGQPSLLWTPQEPNRAQRRHPRT